MREFAERGVLQGQTELRLPFGCSRGCVPATLQAAIRRASTGSTRAKRTLNAASVIGSRFGIELLTALGIDPVLDELGAELIDQVGFTPRAEYAFRHPLIRAVAYNRS